MPPTRRATLAAIGGGVSSQLVPVTTAATAQDGNGSTAGGQNDADASDGTADTDGIVVEWTATETGELNWSCTDAVRAPDGGFVVVCNLVDERVIGPATKLLQVGHDGAIAEFATIGDPGDSSTGHWIETIAPDGDGGYVIGGMELEFENGELVDNSHPLRHVSSDGTTDWTVPSPSPGGVTFPRIVVVEPDEAGYVVAIGERLTGLATGLVAYDEAGEERWQAGFGDIYTPGVEPMDLAPAGGGGVAFLGIRGTSQNTPKPPKPVLARTDAEGIATGPTMPTVDGGRFARSITTAGDRILVTGELTDEQGNAKDKGWAMALDEIGSEPAWSSTYDGATRLYAGVHAVGSAEVVFAGAKDSKGLLLAGESAQQATASHEFDPFVATEVLLPSGDGTMQVVGGTGGDESELFLSRLSTPLDPAAFQTSVGPTTVTPEEPVEFSLAGTGAYDRSLLETQWAADDSVVANGGTGKTTFAETGEHVITATVQTSDSRTATVEHTVTVEEPASDDAGGDDSLPGFGMLAAGGGIAGTVALQRLRGGGSNDDAE